jgi:hypothetical protein
VEIDELMVSPLFPHSYTIFGVCLSLLWYCTDSSLLYLLLYFGGAKVCSFEPRTWTGGAFIKLGSLLFERIAACEKFVEH